MVRSSFPTTSSRRALIALAAMSMGTDTAYAQGSGNGQQGQGSQRGSAAGHADHMERGSGYVQGLGGTFRDVTGLPNETARGGRPTDDAHADEVVMLFDEAADLTVDSSGRLALTVDGVEKIIDSPLENLAIYVALLTQGSIPGVKTGCSGWRRSSEPAGRAIGLLFDCGPDVAEVRSRFPKAVR